MQSTTKIASSSHLTLCKYLWGRDLSSRILALRSPALISFQPKTTTTSTVPNLFLLSQNSASARKLNALPVHSNTTTIPSCTNINASTKNCVTYIKKMKVYIKEYHIRRSQQSKAKKPHWNILVTNRFGLAHRFLSACIFQ